MENMCVDTLADVTQRFSARKELGNDLNDSCAEKTWAPSTGISFGSKTGIFFPVWPTFHMYPLKTVTENASFLKKLDILENSVVLYRLLVWMDENGSM